jgi:hypothetical protein
MMNPIESKGDETMIGTGIEIVRSMLIGVDSGLGIDESLRC